MDTALAFNNMISNQIMPWGGITTEMLQAMQAVPRDLFVQSQFQQLAFADTSLPLSCQQTMLPPKLVARLIQAANPTVTKSILEIGSGSGYMTAILAKLCQNVTTIELHQALHNLAQDNCHKLNITNAKFIHGNFLDVLNITLNFDAIIVTGAIPYIPKVLTDCITTTGKLVMIVGRSPIMNAVVIDKSSTRLQQTKLFETYVQPLEQISDQQTFIF